MRSRSYEIISRTINEANWYLDHRTSIRDVAENFMVSKSTVHRDFTIRLKEYDRDLYSEVVYLLRFNKKHTVEKMNRARRRRVR